MHFDVLCDIMNALPARKNIAVATFALLILLQAGGWFAATGILQWQAKSAAQRVMHRRETPLHTVTLSLDRLARIRVDKKEIRLDGRLYDIKSQRITGDSATLEIYHDRKEEALLDAIGQLLRPGAAENEKLPLQGWLARWLGAVFLLPPALPELSPAVADIFSPVFACALFAAQHVPDAFAPPPRPDVLIFHICQNG